MNYPKLSFLILLAGLQFILSCDDNDKKNICRPTAINYAGFRSHFVYDLRNRVRQITDDSEYGNFINMLQYDEEGRLVRVETTLSSGKPWETFELIYEEANEKPKEMHVSTASESGPTVIHYFEHDDRNRLTKTVVEDHGKFEYHHRYEYDDAGHLTKVYRSSRRYLDEFLFIENHAFDTKPNLFGDLAELEAYYIYVRRVHPGKNNVLTATNYGFIDGSPLAPRFPPESIVIGIEYDKHGLVNHYLSDPWIMGTLYFSTAKYACD